MKSRLLSCIFLALLCFPPAASAGKSQKADSSATVVPRAVEQKKAPSSKAANEAQTAPSNPTSARQPAQTTLSFWKDVLPGTVAVFMLFFGLWQYWKRRQLEREQAREAAFGENEAMKEIRRHESLSAQEKYKNQLQAVLGELKLLGSPEVDAIPVNLVQTFVHLDIAVDEVRERRPKIESREKEGTLRQGVAPSEVLRRAFNRRRFLVVLGDPGSGKTTLLQFYAIRCLQKDGHKDFGFQQPALPLFLPLRDFDAERDLPTNLHVWAEKNELGREVSPEDFQRWLNDEHTLVLLDGLDEIVETPERRNCCRRIASYLQAYKKAKFILTTRRYGLYATDDEREDERIQLGFDHARAEVLDFSPEQQSQFLQGWYGSVYQKRPRPEGETEAEWRKKMKQKGDEKARAIIDYLQEPKNKPLREIAGIPLVLQILAIIWHEREFLPGSLGELYDAALNHMLGYRDRERKLPPPLPPKQSRGVLEPVALEMQDTLKGDEILREDLHKRIQTELDVILVDPAKRDAESFCDYLAKRAGILSRYGSAHYVFRHKSLREFLAGARLADVYHQNEWIERIVGHFDEPWWRETLRFFMAKANDAAFDAFMRHFFDSEKSLNLSLDKKEVLRGLIQVAPKPRVDALRTHLLENEPGPEKQSTLLECLRLIGSEDAKRALEAFQEQATGETRKNAEDILLTDFAAPATETELAEQIKALGKLWQISPPPQSFRNPIELNAEYIRIPGGRYVYQQGTENEEETEVPDIYFAKHPVTNKLYRRFIAYLAGEDEGGELRRLLPFSAFAEQAQVAAKREEMKGMDKYLEEPKSWARQLASGRDDDRRFNQDDQPVVGISWRAARLYCFWLALLQQTAAGNGAPDLPASMKSYRLPLEKEWEWAAGGGKHKYPWGDKPEPNEKLANFGENVGKTTPAGSYPEGATPEGLMDMAGNVWEWQENLFDEDKNWCALRGGSWGSTTELLRCGARNGYLRDAPWSSLGFRVVCAQSSFLKL